MTTGHDVVRELRAADHRLADLAMYAEHLGMEPHDDEGEHRFRERVAGALRGRGQIIEAHEVLNGRRFDDPDGGDRVMTGIAGALASALGMGPPPARDPIHQVGDDIALGTLALAPPDPTAQALGAMFDMLGPGATMDVLDAFGGRG